MRYERFVAARRALWDGFESSLPAAARLDRLGYAEIEDLALRYRQILHDHAIAAARFPRTEVARRLHRLAIEGAHALQREHTDRIPGLAEFFGRRFPAAMRRHLQPLLVVSVLFAAVGLFGYLAAFVQPALGAALLGEKAVADLQRGRLWTEALTTSIPPAVSSSGIATNNIGVAVTAWAGGALAGLGSFYVVVLNGFMLGSVFGTTARYGMAGELLEFVSAHGPLEISLILVSAAAGLSLGRALLVPDDRPRQQAMREAGRESLLVLLGCAPWFVLLGLVEALVSPSPALGPLHKAVLGAALLAVFLLVAFVPLSKERPR